MTTVQNFADLSGKTVLVTGASRGLGRHYALTLARAGAKVALAARRQEALTELAREIEAFDGRAVPLELDVTAPDSVCACVERACTELGPISALINNAGIAVERSLLDDTEAEWQQVMDTNLNGVWRVAREVAKQMINMGHGGSIVNISSILGLTATKGVGSYCASKAAVINLTKAMAMEWASHDIRVNAIAPGYFETDLNRDFLHSEIGAKLLKRVPQQRFGEFQDLDGPLLLLVSDCSRYMTGSVITVDGGLTAGI